MAILTTFLASEGRLTIRVNGRFGFESHRDFMQCFQNVATTPTAYTVDLSDTTELDSSALGMLLLLRDFAGGDRSDITIDGVSSDIIKIFQITSFDNLFNIPQLRTRALAAS